MRARSSRCPIFLAALSFAGGVLTASYAWRPASWWLVASVCATAFGLAILGIAQRLRQSAVPRKHAAVAGVEGCVWRERAAYSLVLCALFALGAWTLEVRDAAHSGGPDIRRFMDGDDPETITAHVTHDGVLHGGGRMKRQSLDVETDDIDGAPVKIGMRLSIYAHDMRGEQPDQDEDEGALPAVFVYGERLRFPAKLREPRNFNNPGAQDFKGYLLRQGIQAQASVRGDQIEVLPGTSGTIWGRWRSRASRAVRERIHQLWPRQQAALLDAMLLGERSLITRETNTAWQRTGIYHILVVSGMNVAIFASVLFWVFRRMRCGKIPAVFLTLLISVAYAYLAESGAPVLRAVLMLALFLAADLVYREGSLLNSLGAAGLVLLVAEPRSLWDASFQLTFSAVAAVAGIAAPLLERTTEPWCAALRMPDLLRRDLRLAPRFTQFRLDLRMIAGRVARMAPKPLRERTRKLALWSSTSLLSGTIGIGEVLVVSGLMQFALALPMAVCFHRATVMSLPANAVAVPLAAGILMPACMAALALSPFSLFLARIPAAITSLCLRATLATIAALDRVPWADLRVPAPTWQMVAASLAAVSAAMLLVRRRWWLAGLGVAGVLASGLWLTIGAREPLVRHGVLEVTNIDVGQAESALVVTPEGKTLLVDSAGPIGPFHGEFDFGEDVIAPYLWARRFRRLDAVMITHAHSDHYGGMISVISDFHPRELWLGPNVRTAEFGAVLDHAVAKGVKIVPRVAGQEFAFGGAEVKVLSPPEGWKLSKRPVNNDSLVIRVSYGGTAAVLTGDAEKKVERALVEAKIEPADLLKLAHNGSNTSSTAEFLDMLKPKYAAISVGAHNIFRHPRPEVLERLAERHIATYRTDAMGALTFYLDGQRVTPMPEVLAKR
jgi:competence protein ComEC